MFCWHVCSCQRYKTDKLCYKNAKLGSHCVFVDIYVAVNSIKRMNCATGTQKWVPFVFCWHICSCQQYKPDELCYKNAKMDSPCTADELQSFRTADNNTNLSLHEKCPPVLSNFNVISRFSTNFRYSLQCKISSNSIQLQSRWSTADRRTDMIKVNWCFTPFMRTCVKVLVFLRTKVYTHS